MNNCLCNIFDDKCIWIIIIALLILFSCNNGNGCGNGCNNGCGFSGCGGCGCN